MWWGYLFVKMAGIGWLPGWRLAKSLRLDSTFKDEPLYSYNFQFSKEYSILLLERRKKPVPIV